MKTLIINEMIYGTESLLKKLPSYRAKQIESWVYRGVCSFDEMTDIPLSLREELSKNYCLRETDIDKKLYDDYALKLRLKLRDNVYIETVLLSDAEGRRTACLSTQAGCPNNCVFCKTGKLGFKRSLTASEIAEQFLHLRDAAKTNISNIVFMGMGEALLNFEELKKAISFLENIRPVFNNDIDDEESFNQKNFQGSHRRITVSTSGIVKGIRALTDELPGLRLALSLPAADDELRGRLMPIARTNPLSEIKAALLYYQERAKKRITLETALLGGINTSEKNAKDIADFSRGLKVIVNIIPWNPVEGLMFEGKALSEPSKIEIETFARALRGCHIKIVSRREKGRLVQGACGQLGAL